MWQHSHLVQAHQHASSLGTRLAVSLSTFGFHSAGKHHQPADNVFVVHWLFLLLLLSLA
jgi:hypothetical protein